MHTFDISPSDLLDWLRWRLCLPTDRALATLLAIPGPSLSKIRHGVMPLGPSVMVRILETADVRLRDLPLLLDQTAIFWSRQCRP